MSVLPVLRTALMARLRARVALATVNILDHQPVKLDDLRSFAGRREVLWTGDASGPITIPVMTGGTLRLSEQVTLPLFVMVQGTSRSDDQSETILRTGALVDEVFAELAAQASWPESADVAAFDHWEVTPSAQQWINDRLADVAGAYASMCELSLLLSARRTYS